jgi:hypothetical protein
VAWIFHAFYHNILGEEEMKVALVGRHKLLDLQVEALKEAGFEIAEQIINLPNDPKELRAFAEELRKRVDGIVTVALPPQILAVLQDAGFRDRIYVFAMNSKTVATEEEAKKWVEEAPDRRTYLPGRPGEPVRVLEFVGLDRVKITIETNRVWSVEEYEARKKASTVKV